MKSDGSIIGWVLMACVLLFFAWLFYKGYKAYKKNGWDDPFFNHNDGDGSGNHHF